MAIQFMIDYRS